MTMFSKRTLTMVFLSVAMAFGATAAQAQPTFSKAFNLPTIGPGSTSVLTFTITNGDPAPATALAFTDVLPAAVTIATPSSAVTDCGTGTVSAPDGGGTIALSDGQVPGFGSCTVVVNVTSSTIGTHMNVSGDLTSSAGNSGTATADLIVNGSIPGFSKSFSPSTISVGARSTLTFTIDNTASGLNALSLSFSDVFPPGLVIADPANASTTCTGGVLMAMPGAGTFSYSPAFFGDASVAAGATCTVSVDVTTSGIGTFDNVSGALTGFTNTSFISGTATASIAATQSTLGLTKAFTDDPTLPGGTVNLEFTIQNRDRVDALTNITFTDDLDATLSGLVATGLPLVDPCGAGSSLTGTSLITLTGGNLPAEGSCTFSVTLQVPPAAAAGGYPNTTSTITGDLGGSPIVGDAASETLFVNEAPSLTKTFLSNPVAAGDTASVEFTITNNSTTSTATTIAFNDNLAQFLSGVVVSGGTGSGVCGAGSNLFTAIIGGDLTLSLIGGNVAASDSCTFTVDFLIPPGTPPGAYVNTTTEVSATVDGMTQIGPQASDTLTVVGAPQLNKLFTDDPVLPGGTVTLEFTISQPIDAAGDATAIAFTDDLDAALSGLMATGLPLNDMCGVGSQISGTSVLSFTGGTLAPGASCTFSVTLQVPMGVAGIFTNTTSGITATSLGLSVTGPAAADDLVVAGLTFTKEFIDDPIVPGGTGTLRFTLANDAMAPDATGIFFTDSLSAALTGLVALAPLPTEPCGTGSSISGTSFLIMVGGNLLAGETCAFDVTVMVPAGAAPGSYGNVTSSLTATVGGSVVVLPPAADVLEVSSTLLSLTKEFTDDPVAPGGVVNLEFTLTNLDPTETVTGISFTDDLDAALTGMTLVATPPVGFCGAGATASGGSVLTVTGAELAGGASCTFSVSVMVPAMVAGGMVVTNTTSSVTGTANGLAVTGDPASGDLLIDTLTLTKSFDGPTTATGAPVLTLTITNLSTTTGASALGFSDDLDAVLTGLVATGLPMNDVCGAGSVLSGTSFLTLTGASLLPSGSCSIPVTLAVPAGAAAGTYPNTTSDLFASGLPVAAPATADLVIEPPPTFAKAFNPAFIGLGQNSNLTFTIDNTASALAATGLDFTDSLPAGVVVATPTSASTTCTGGTLTAVAGSGVISYTGGTVAAGASCTVQALVTGTAVGAHVNTTGDLTSSSGTSGTATDTLTVNPQKEFSKAFAPNPITAGGVSSLTFTIDNSGSSVAATLLAFTDTLPAGMTVATPANVVNTCGGGTVTATSGTGTISYTGGSVPAGMTCTLQVDVTSNIPGMNLNVSGTLTSSLGTGGSATATLDVDFALPTFAKAFAPDPISAGGVSTLTFTIDNLVNGVAVPNLAFTDDFPAAISVATSANVVNTCGGTFTAAPGAGLISLTGGTVAALSSCTISLDVTANQVGTHVNTTGDLTSDAGNSGTATDDLTVNFVLPTFAKAFAPNPISAGGVSTLTFTIDNPVNGTAVTALDFTDNLPAAITVATPPNAATTCTGGTITAVAGSGVISYTGGTVAALSSCTVSVDVTANVAGDHVNLTGDLTSVAGNSGTATDTLTVNLVAPGFSKVFAPDAIEVGSTSTLTFTIDNAINGSPVANLAFVDNLPVGVVVGTPANASTTCTGGTLTAVAGSGSISYSGGTVAALGSCTVSVDVTSTTPGIYTNTSGELTSDAGSSGTATDDLTVIGLIIKNKVFNVNPVLRGGLVNLEFTVTGDDNVTVSDLAFTDDLDAVIPGLAATGLPMNDVCGPGSVVSGTSVISLTGGTLAPGASCVFTVAVQVPADAPLGLFTNTTSSLTGTAAGIALTGPPASADLDVTYLLFEKSFSPDPVIAGLQTPLTFTIMNPDPVNSATGISFTDDLDAAVPGMMAVGLPMTDVCGVGSQIDGTLVMTLTGGTLGPSESCTFTVFVMVPGATTMGTYTNVTSELAAVVNGNAVIGDPADVAIADVTVESNPVAIPTVGHLGLFLLAGLLAGLGWFAIRRTGLSA